MPLFWQVKLTKKCINSFMNQYSLPYNMHIINNYNKPAKEHSYNLITMIKFIKATKKKGLR